MRKNRLILLLKLSGVIGLASGSFFMCYELFKYIFENPALYSGLAKLLYVVAYLLLVPVLVFRALKKRKAILSFIEKFTTVFIAYTVSVSLMTMNLVVIHYGIDPSYRERIAEHSINNIIAAKAKIEMERNVKIVNSNVDFEKIRNTELENHKLKNLLLTPVKFAPLIFIFSLVSATILYSLLPRP
jgi:hypothetical protein